MKKEKMLRAMELADESYVAEADPRKGRPKRIWMRIGLVAACFCMVLGAFNLWMFLPFSTEPPDVSAYRDSEYYSIIQKLNALTYQKPQYKNNFELYSEKFWDVFAQTKEDGADFAPGMNGMANGTISGIGGSQSYEEVTDNQVEGVIEADRIKRSDRYVYYLNGKTLSVYSIEGIESEKIGSYTLGDSSDNTDEWEFYLSEDCNTVTVMMPSYFKSKETCVELVALDVTDPTKITQKANLSVTGSYLSSRMVDGRILLMTRFYAGNRFDFSDESTFLPQIDCGNGKESIAAADIASPDVLTNSAYTVVLKLEDDTLSVLGSSAFLSYSENAYVSEDHIFVTRSYRDQSTEGGYRTSKQMTEISALFYGGEEMAFAGKLCVEGYTKDQYSMDEHEGILRVVTTTDASRYKESRDGETVSIMVDTEFRNGTSANLYCIDLENWQIVAQVIGFAPKGETVRSVRFDGDSAYVCTAIQVTDPVFFFDLSDLSNITYTDTGNIDGFSTSLIQFGNGHLLGIGVNGNQSLKLEIYREGENGVESVCSYEPAQWTYSSGDYKAYFIDRQRQLIGLGITTYVNVYMEEEAKYFSMEESRYILLYFDGESLQVLLNEQLDGSNDHKRGVLIEDDFYLFGTDQFKVCPIE